MALTDAHILLYLHARTAHGRARTMACACHGQHGRATDISCGPAAQHRETTIICRPRKVHEARVLAGLGPTYTHARCAAGLTSTPSGGGDAGPNSPKMRYDAYRYRPQLRGSRRADAPRKRRQRAGGPRRRRGCWSWGYGGRAGMAGQLRECCMEAKEEEGIARNNDTSRKATPAMRALHGGHGVTRL